MSKTIKKRIIITRHKEIEEVMAEITLVTIGKNKYTINCNTYGIKTIKCRYRAEGIDNAEILFDTHYRFYKSIS